MRKRKEKGLKTSTNGKEKFNTTHSPSEAGKEDKDRDAMGSSSSALPPSTREGCIMGASEALNKLTKETDEDDEDSEWMIIKVSKKR